MTPRQLFVRPEGYPSDIQYTVAFGRSADPVALPAKAGGSSGLLLDVRHTFAIVANEATDRDPSWRTATRAYEYRLLDTLERELLVFHWQPDAASRGPGFPHLHVSATLEAQTGAGSRRFALDKRHVPTGRVSLAAVIQLLIAEFGIAYRHRNWASRLQRAEDIPRTEEQL